MRLIEASVICRFDSYRVGSVFLALFLILALAFPSVAAEAERTATEPLAEVNGETITTKELENKLGAKLANLEEQIYDLKRQELDSLIAEKLLAQEAAKRKISVAALLDTEVTAKVPLVTEAEIDAFYQANKSRIRSDDAETRQKIRAFLQQQKLTAQRSLFIESLRSQGKVSVNLQPPPVIRVEVSIKDAPFRGPADAPVTLVEFSDFECPFCKRAHPTLMQLLEKYAGKVKLVYRDYPLESIHPQARGAAEAARCAQDQGKFWEYYDLLFTESPKLSPDDLKRYATQVGLDGAKFDACVAGGAHKAVIQRDLDEGNRLGITGTPAFFVNGRPLTGAQPLEAFTRVIDDELARVAGPLGGIR
ncbi:MAG TPA: thioredoxin domain-containing protein [Candidatus Binatia bacterium]|jgi:protein-disulfide isomerase